MRRIRVLVYIKNLNGGGAERAVVDLVNGLDRRVFEPLLVLGDRSGAYLGLVRPGDVWGERSSEAREPGRIEAGMRIRSRIGELLHWASSTAALLRVLGRLPAGRAGFDRVKGLLRSRKVRRLRAAIEQFEPDVILTSLLETASLLVWLVRETSPQGVAFPRWIAVEQNNTLARIRALYGAEEAAFWRGMTAQIYRDADAVVAVSRGVATGLTRYFDVPADRISVIPNHVDLDLVEPAVPISRPRPFVLAVGRLHGQKDFATLIAAFAPVARTSDVDLVILGDGELRPELEAEVRRLGLEGRVHLPGFRDDLWGLMKSAACFVLSSRFEGMPLTLLEAMGAGCPVVAFDCDYGPSEVIVDGVDGILVEPGDLRGLSAGISRLVCEPEFARGLAESARIRVKAYHRAESIAAYERLIESVTASRFTRCESAS